MEAAVLMIAPVPIWQSTFTTAPAKSTDPAPISTYRLTTAEGWISTGTLAPPSTSSCNLALRIWLLPMATKTPSNSDKRLRSDRESPAIDQAPLLVLSGHASSKKLIELQPHSSAQSATTFP